MVKDAKKIVGAELENANQDVPLTKNVNKNVPQFSDREWLEKNDPIDFCVGENTSSKFDAGREVAIQNGLPKVVAIEMNGKTINPLLILLGKWWEVKPARASIKKMIDAEAEAKGIDKDVYLQVNLATEVDEISEMQSAIDRIRYAKTYFKPRKPLSDKVITKLVKIEGVTYVVPVQAFETLKAELGTDREALIKATIEISKVQNLEVESL